MNTKPWFTLSENGARSVVTIGDNIGSGEQKAVDLLASLRGVPPEKEMDLFVNSNGGSIIEGLAVFNAFLARPSRVVAKIESFAASMGTVVPMAADEIEVAANAWMVIHNPFSGAGGDAEELRKTADLLDRLKPQLIDAYMRHAKVSREQISAMMDAETWIDADQAVEMGFATRKTGEIKLAACLENPGFSKIPDAAKHLFGEVTITIETEPAKPEEPEQPETVEAPDAPVEPETTETPATPEEDKDKRIAELEAENERLKNELADATAATDSEKQAAAELTGQLTTARTLSASLEERISKMTGGMMATPDQGGARKTAIERWKALQNEHGYEGARKKFPDDFANFMANARR